MTQEQMQQQVLEQIAAFKSRMQTALSRTKPQAAPAAARPPLQNQPPPQQRPQHNDTQGHPPAQNNRSSTYQQVSVLVLFFLKYLNHVLDKTEQPITGK